MESDIQSRLAILNEAFTNKSRFEDETRELSTLVHSCQQQLQQLTRGIGPQQDDAQGMLERAQVSLKEYLSVYIFIIKATCIRWYTAFSISLHMV